MDPNDDFSRFKPTGPIPEDLHSAYERGPFRACVHCGEVLTDGRVYEIQKVFRGTEVVFEMAVCHSCGESLSREFSEESLERVQTFLVNNFKPSTKAEHCNFCGFPRGLFENYTLLGACRASSLLVPSIVICNDCSEKLQEVLSKKTRDANDDFIRDHFPGVPADLDLSPTLSGLFP